MVKAFLTIKHGHEYLGTLHLELYDDVVPRTVKNFMALLEGSGRLTYRNTISHRLIPGFMAQFGDITKGDGTGGESIYGDRFDDENFVKTHDRKGMLSMANAGPNTNGSQFFLTFRKTPHLDGKHVVFGHVDLEQSKSVLYQLEKVKTDRDNKPLKPVVIVDCGVIFEEEAEEIETENNVPAQEKVPINEEEEITVEIPTETQEEEQNMTKAQALKARLRKLQMKMNQARQLNRRAVRQEGEVMGSEEGKAKQKQQQNRKDKELQKEAWEARNGKAVQMAGEMVVDAKYLAEPASSSLKSAARNAGKAEARKHSVRDYHNPEGQHRNYQRNVRNIPRQEISEDATTNTFNPILDAVDPEREREGARRLANELHRRIEKSKHKRQRLEFEETDVTYINKRNKLFNKKISRNYDQATAEIKQNLERGTAL